MDGLTDERAEELRKEEFLVAKKASSKGHRYVVYGYPFPFPRPLLAFFPSFSFLLKVL